jgi:SAM-dependent methyltransferase
VDFGSAATDYARHRKGFPGSFFDRVPLKGPILDLGSGTGTLARGYAGRGARVVALDLSPAMLGQASGLPMRVAARAERCPFREGSFGAVVAGQCWHWFDGPAVARECRRLLQPGGRLLIARFDYLPMDDNAAAATEELILSVNPGWPLAGAAGLRYDFRPHLAGAGFERMETLTWDEAVSYSHEGWRGRIRACNGVIELRDPARIADFDARLKKLLAERFPDPVVVPHRISVLWGDSP